MVSREVRLHRSPGNSLNNQLTIGKSHVGAGGAPLIYKIKGPDGSPYAINTTLQFQQGDPNVEVNGLSNEALLAVLIDRMDGFQDGPFKCDDNDTILYMLRGAMEAMHRRSAERAARGVEGKQVK